MHLGAVLRLNEFSALARTRAAASADRLSMAVANPRGLLHAVEPEFERWLGKEWPGWGGPVLPAALCQALQTGQPTCEGRHVSARLERAGDRVLLTLTERPAAQRLTPQERAVAESYAQGHSHKDVARQLGLSPVTVRGYLRQAYDKLGVNDKAQLARAER
jgi:DNA-binding CsgD family transcriptional regulator